MELYILRHGIAEDRAAGSDSADSERALTGEGMKKTAEVGMAMKKLGLKFDLILSSPYLRAKQTAEIVAKKLKHRNIQYTKNLSEGTHATLIGELEKHHKDKTSLLLVGHEPFLSGLISLLISGGESADITLKKGGLCKLTIATLKAGQCASIDWLFTPGTLKALAGR